MKLFPTVILSLALAGQGFAGIIGEGYINFIRQTQQTSGIVWDMPVTPTGTSVSSYLPLEEKGAVFQLWTIKSDTQKEYFIGQQTVGTYLPQAVIRVKTADPYTTVARTRADQPFTIEIDVTKLQDGANAPNAAKKVLLQRFLAPYPAGQFSVDPRVASSGTPKEQSYITTTSTATSTVSLANDGTYTAKVVLPFKYTSLVASNPSTPSRATLEANGEEHFVVHALADDTATQTEIARGVVQIWPVATGTITGINNGDLIKAKAPPLTITLNNLYPRSDTWMQIYPGPQKVGTVGNPIVGSYLILDGATSQNRTIKLEDYDGIFGTATSYTLEVLTKTPFGTEVLASKTVNLERVLAIRAQLGGTNVGGTP